MRLLKEEEIRVMGLLEARLSWELFVSSFLRQQSLGFHPRFPAQSLISENLDAGGERKEETQ